MACWTIHINSPFIHQFPIETPRKQGIFQPRLTTGMIYSGLSQFGSKFRCFLLKRVYIKLGGFPKINQTTQISYLSGFRDTEANGLLWKFKGSRACHFLYLFIIKASIWVSSNFLQANPLLKMSKFRKVFGLEPQTTRHMGFPRHVLYTTRESSQPNWNKHVFLFGGVPYVNHLLNPSIPYCN